MFDPQLYLPTKTHKKLKTYPYYPEFLSPGFSTSDFEEMKTRIAEECIGVQSAVGVTEFIIPSRYYEDEPSDYLERNRRNMIQPFKDLLQERDPPALQTVIVKGSTLLDDAKRNYLLDWITGFQGLSGVYLIFDIPYASKQIKDANVLAEAVYFVHVLKRNQLTVHVGYTNTEALILSLGLPDSVTMGSYENVRSFSVLRFTDREKKRQSPPNARLYSAKLLQWVDHSYVKSIENLYPDWRTIFPDSRYTPTLFEPTFNWHFTKPELYKHSFIEFDRQISSLPPRYDERKLFVNAMIDQAIEAFKEIGHYVLLDSDSDGSHLTHWSNSIALFEKKVNDRW